jgi:hypothetical protein
MQPVSGVARLISVRVTWVGVSVVMSSAFLFGCGASEAHLPAAELVLPKSCPPMSPSGLPHNRDTSGLASHMAPERPQEAMLCRFYPRGGPNVPGTTHGGLYAAKNVDAQTARRLVKELNSIPRPPKGVYHCPADFTTVDTLTFGYKARPPVTIIYHRSGCITVSNGVRSGTASGALAAFRGDLDRIIQPRP